jgi:hypothetical protein
VLYDASCEARNGAVAVTSSGCPNRFIGTFATISFANSSMASWASPVRAKIGVTIGPGAKYYAESDFEGSALWNVSSRAITEFPVGANKKYRPGFCSAICCMRARVREPHNRF